MTEPSIASRRTAARNNGSKAWASPRAWRSTPSGNLFVGDRSGTIFKISPDRQIFVFATLEPSIAAYHLAFSPRGRTLRQRPHHLELRPHRRINRQGEVSVFYRGFGRPQGLAFDAGGNLYVAASKGGRRGIVRITPDREADVVLSGSGLVGSHCCPRGALY